MLPSSLRSLHTHLQSTATQEVEQGPPPTADLSLVQRRIKEVTHVLENFGKLRAEGRSRKQYMEQVCVV